MSDLSVLLPVSSMEVFRMTQLYLVYLLLLGVLGVTLAFWISHWINTRKYSVPTRRFLQMLMHAQIWGAVVTALIISPFIAVHVFGPRFEIGGLLFDYSLTRDVPDRFWGVFGCCVGFFLIGSTIAGCLIVGKQLKRCEPKEMPRSNRENCGQENGTGPSD